MSKENGGPAFPGFDFVNQGGKKNPEGMTLRDYFAAKAMQGFVNELGVADDEDEFAKKSYKMADAMLKAREE